MEKGKDIYFEQRIYKGCELPVPAVECPFNLAEDTWLSQWSFFRKCIATLTNYAIEGSHNWEDGQCVDGLYELQHQFKRGDVFIECSKSTYGSTGFDKRIAAIPVVPKDNTEASINPGTKNYPLFKFFADTHNLILLDSEIEDIIDRVIENI